MTEPTQAYRFGLRLSERGSVTGVGDGIAWVRGLPSVRLDELIGFEDGSIGLVFQLSKELLGAILLSQTHGVNAGMSVQRLDRKLEIGVGEALLGRVVDPLGDPPRRPAGTGSTTFSCSGSPCPNYYRT